MGTSHPKPPSHIAPRITARPPTRAQAMREIRQLKGFAPAAANAAGLLRDTLKAKGNDAFAKGAEDEGKFWEAALWYSHAILVSPAEAALYSNRSVSFQRLGRPDEAVRDARRCVALRPDWPKGYYRLAVAYRDMGCVAEARSAIADAEAIAPDDEAIGALVRELRKMA